jgi:hypothetical protein
MILRVIGGMAVLTLSVATLTAQQPHGQRSDSQGTERRGDMQMMMDSLNHRLDSLVDRMNRTSGNQKVNAMAAVINELVSQRKGMQERMHRMMEHEDRMHDKGDSPSSGAKPRRAATDTGHETHHSQE